MGARIAFLKQLEINELFQYQSVAVVQKYLVTI